KLTNNGPLIPSAAKHSIYTLQLTQKIARLCSKERTIEGCGLSRAPVFSLFPAPQLSSRGRRLRAIFHELDNAGVIGGPEDGDLRAHAGTPAGASPGGGPRLRCAIPLPG